MRIPFVWKGLKRRNSSASSKYFLRGKSMILISGLQVRTTLTAPRSACEETTKTCPNFDMWFPVVKLARMWECDDIHKYAVKRMPYDQICKTPAEKVGLAVNYDIKPWLLPGLNELAKRDEPLGNYDLELLGSDLTLKVAAVRESLAWNKNHPGGGLVAGKREAKGLDFTPVIKRMFQISGESRQCLCRYTLPGIVTWPRENLDKL